MQNEFSRYFTKEETRCIFRIISVVLNIGNLTFKKELTRNNEEMAVPVNKECLATVAKLL
jgi:myosin heavy subunit